MSIQGSCDKTTNYVSTNKVNQTNVASNLTVLLQ